MEQVEEQDARELIFALHKQDGAPPIGRLPGLWERKLNELWTIWVNGQLETRETAGGAEVLSGDCYVEFNGWPAGSFSLITGEGIIAVGEAANYETFRQALAEAVR